MTDSTSIAARRFSDLHPGFELVHAEEAAVPVSWLTVEMLAQERRPLPVVDEYLLRLANRGVNEVAAIAAVLGLDDETVRDAVAQQLSAETVDYRPDQRGGRVVVLTPAGRRAVTDLATTTPKRVEQARSFDRLLWEPTSHTSSELISSSDAKHQNRILLPSRRTYDVSTDDINARMLNYLLEQHSRGQEPSVEILTVEAIIRQPRRYLPAVLLVFSATGFSDVRLSVIIDDSTSEAHDTALNELGGAELLKIRVEPPIEEPALPSELQALRASHSTVRGLQRRADSATSSDDATGEHTSPQEPDDSVTARAELSSLTVRSVPVFEHREQLAAALDSATSRFLLATPAVSASVVTDDMIHRLETMLRRRGLIAHIVYGLGHADSHLDSAAIARLETLAGRHDNLILIHSTESHPNILVFDDTWVNSSFNWLSYRGTATRTYRKTEGTLVRSKEITDEKYAQFVRKIDLS